MSKRKVRFVVAVRGVRRELFAIRETTKGDLVILKKASETLDFEPMRDVPLADHRYSVHPSPSSEGITITQRLLLQDQTKADTYAHIKPNAGHIIWPLAVQASQDLGIDRYVSHHKGSDIVVDVCAYDPRVSVLLYMAIVTDRMTNIRHTLADPAYHVKMVRFANFTFWVVATLMNVPSTYLGRTLISGTHSPRINGENIIPVNGQITPGIGWSLDSVAFEAKSMMLMASRSWYISTEEWFLKQENPDLSQLPFLDEYSRVWTKKPLMEGPKTDG